MKVALAQINPLVGDVAGNTDRILQAVDRAAAAGAHLVITPELAVLGYPPKDLLLKEHLIRQNLQAVDRIARASQRIAIVVGFAQPSTSDRGKPLHNVAAFCQQGQVAGIYGKHLLPTYDVFDELRYFEPLQSPALTPIDLPGLTGHLGISICEDLWNYAPTPQRLPYNQDPIAELVGAGANLLLNISASPYSLGKQDHRLNIFSAQIAHHRVPLIYVNQVGAHDDLIFDGASAVFSATGQVIAQAHAFQEDLLIVDLDNPDAASIAPYPDDITSLYQALRLGTVDYVNKCKFQATVIGLSGGIDSAVTAAIAVDALGPDRVHGVALPSRYSSDHSLTDAQTLASNLGIDLINLPIHDIHQAMETQLAPHFGPGPPGIAEENIQARIRGNLLMGLSNKHGWLLLTTGNKSELAVGYCTLYGDMCGGLALLSDVPKTMVYQLARFINKNANRELIPQNTITKPPSAELKPDQTDQDSLPPYDTLDAILERYVEEERSIEQIVADGFDPQTVRQVVRLVDRNEYKRKQAPVGLKVTGKAFGTGRRMPIAAHYT